MNLKENAWKLNASTHYFILLTCVAGVDIKVCLSIEPNGSGGSLCELVICILLNTIPSASIKGARHASIFK